MFGAAALGHHHQRATTFVVQEFQHGRIVLDTGYNDLYALLIDGAGQPTGFISLD